MKVDGEVTIGGRDCPGLERRGVGFRGAFLLALGFAPLLISCGGERSGEIQASGTVEAREADLGFQIAGRIGWIGPNDGDPVREGDEVARLDTEELDARRRAAEGQMEAARALLAEMASGFRPGEIAEGQAALRGTEEQMADARRDLDRARRLFDGGAISREMLDKAETVARVVESAVDQARERVLILEEGPRQERVAAQRAMVSQAEAAVAQVDAALSNARITVPFPGVVTIKHREPGETVAPGLPVLTVMDPEDRWVRIYVREDRIGEVQLGQEATITSDTYPDRTYRGKVIFIANESEFTPRNVQTTEERVKLVYAVKVRITEDPSHDLKAGIPADVVLAGTGESGG
ncbi:MAG: HlyD family efflux transporter periplasmic adaptor subunit [Gemmatimonadota bacterium]